MFIITYKNFFLVITGIIVLLGLGSAWYFGLPLGIDFTGGSILEVAYETPPDVMLLQSKVQGLNLGGTMLQPVGKNGILLRTRPLSEPERVALTNAVGGRVVRFDSIGPVIGSELRAKSLWGISVVILLIVLYITFAFRKVSRPVASWKYGLTAVAALVHDMIVPTGFYALYAHYTGAEVDVLFVTAILAILGFSVHDTIVVFDRIRENLMKAPRGETFDATVGKSLSQTFTRSINTSLTVALVLVSLIIFGGASTTHFAVLLLAGIIAGTYSSIFLASPLLTFVL